MNVLVVGMEGLASGLVWALVRNKESNTGFAVIKAEGKSILKGIANHVDDWEKEKDNYDLIVFEDTGFGRRADELKKDGYMVIGASEVCDKLEMDREFAAETAKKYMDIKIPQTETFTDWDKAIKFLENSDKQWVVKFNGLAGNYKDLLYVSELKNNQDLIFLLKFYKDHVGSRFGDTSFVLQEKINGIEVGITGFFNGSEFVKPYYLDKEYKRNLAGDAGVFTGQEGELQYWTSRECKLFDITLKKIEEVLKNAKYIGSFNVNGILNDEGYWFLEFTPRFGYNSQSLEIEFLRQNGYGPLGWIGDTKLDCMSSWVVGAVITVPPYPHGSDVFYEQLSKGLPIFFENNEIPPNVYLHDVEYADGYYKTSGTFGYIASAVGVGDNPEDARENMLNTVKKVSIPKKQYRNDVGLIHGIRKAFEWK